MSFKFVLNETSYFGKGSRQSLVEEIKNRGFKKVFLVSDKALVEANTKVAPKWLETNLEEMSAKVVALPAREDIDLEIAEHLIIELYSK